MQKAARTALLSEKIAKLFKHNIWRFELRQVSNMFHSSELTLPDQSMERSTSVDRNPWVIDTPQNSYRAPNVVEMLFDFSREFFVSLGELPVKTNCSLGRDPWRNELLEIKRINVVDQRAFYVGFDNRFMNVIGKASKRFNVLAHVIEKG